MISFLRAETAEMHERVDGVFGRYSLTDTDSYARLLRAHALALPAAERVLESVPGLPAWRSRTDALSADLSALGTPMPAPLPLAPAAGLAEALGMLYVTEGSRLGGVMLSRQVRPDLPSAYLSAGHLPGEWRAMVAAIDTTIAALGPDATKDAVAGAIRTFQLYETAAH
ncbi:heme oxygenase [Sphingomonas jejuensis]|uniref:Heme oxygenase n=1 Tax=Sphingomonas jejuensis TaxID=904715 RepID=A0ABX0XK03_9SPHN|nr:biliverdin-producing heme oxygenase [Sphingomonas jejuensis]NJC33674.1 heme oxygenase [Sphingomonas jejuensis]